MTSPTIGDPVPDFSAKMTGEGTFTLSNFVGKNLIIYFYPKDNTPGCTTEGIEFNAAIKELASLNTLVFGVSRDSLKTHENFRTKHNFTFDLIADTDETVCGHFAVIKLKKLYGKEYLGIERSTFLIDANGKLAAEWRKVKVKDHVNQVLMAVKALPIQ